MKKEWIALILVLTLVTPMAACGSDRNSTVGGNAGNSAGNSAADNGPGYGSGTGSAGNGSASSNADGGSVANGSASSNGLLDNGSVNREAGQTSRSANSNAYNGYTAQRRTAYDYLEDARYSADKNGRVSGPWNPNTRDFTQGARDIVRDTGDAAGDLGRSIGNAVGDVGRGIGNAVDDISGSNNASRNTVKQ